MSINSNRVIDWRRRTKERIVQSFGGKCGICGYDKCHESMDLHHLDPTEKEFGFGSIRSNPKSWEKIVIELRKCVLLCKNCHGEYHYNGLVIPENIKRFDEEFSNYSRLKEEDRISNYYEPCPICGSEKSKITRTCSLKCAASLTHSIKWDKFDLSDLYVTQRMSLRRISKIVGCSPSAVVKRLRKLGLK